MSVKLQPNMTQSLYYVKMCEDYWAYDNQSDFIKHVKTLCDPCRQIRTHKLGRF